MNILTTDDWSSGGSYNINSFVAWPAGSTTYWYCTKDAPANGGDPPALDNPNWAGQTTSDGGQIPRFIWTPSYNINKKMQPKVKQIQFGDGYSQIIKDGINNTLLELDLGFEQRNINEAGAILHFLTAREGAETFIFTPPSPYATAKKWKCIVFNDTQPFFNNFTIKATFIEVLI